MIRFNQWTPKLVHPEISYDSWNRPAVGKNNHFIFSEYVETVRSKICWRHHDKKTKGVTAEQNKVCVSPYKGFWANFHNIKCFCVRTIRVNPTQLTEAKPALPKRMFHLSDASELMFLHIVMSGIEIQASSYENLNETICLI